MVKRMLTIAAWALCGVGIIFLTGFAISRNQDRELQAVEVSIERSADHFFIQEQDIKTQLIRNGYGITGQNLGSVNVSAIEKLLLAHAAVQNCEASVTVDGKLKIDILQRRPIARIINMTGESYYFDDRGHLMPWSDIYTAPVVLVNGNFADSYAAFSNVDFPSTHADSVGKTLTVLDDIWQIVNAIETDSLMRVQIAQVYYNPDKEFELIPRIGDHKILLGKAEGVAGKFRKLELFYQYGLNKTGKWTDYSSIDLRFKNQIVCTKKPN